MQTLQPPGWARPKGYANGIAAEGRQVFVAGQVGWDESESFASDDFVAQAEQALRNIVAILAEAGVGPEHLTRMTWYLGDKQEYLERAADLGQAYRRVIGKHFPAMTAIEVSGFVEDGAKVEIEATAVIG
jgi:enamine deaminase RidA (YjgF/YER057c/UK114 family)